MVNMVQASQALGMVWKQNERNDHFVTNSLNNQKVQHDVSMLCATTTKILSCFQDFGNNKKLYSQGRYSIGRTYLSCIADLAKTDDVERWCFSL